MDNMIIRNAARCRNCGDEIESTHRHDFVTCSCFTDTEDCTGIFVDGGKDYLRAGGNPKNFISLLEATEDDLT